MRKEVNLHFGSTSRGPGKVVENLSRGFVELGWTVTANAPIKRDVYQGCLQSVSALNHLDRDVVVGPNLFVIPSDWGQFCKKFDHYIVPCNWVKDIYLSYEEMSHATIDVWPVGIDVNTWNKTTNFSNRRILVYFKSRKETELNEITSYLDKKGLNYEVLRYGSYKEKDLYDACLRCDSCILLTGTESQGIAYMQILSTGIPCYVIDKTDFDYFDQYKKNPPYATSVPYFNDKCGIRDSIFTIEHYEKFLDKLESFNPRSYIEENFSLIKCAQNYIQILEKYKTEVVYGT